MDPSDLPALAAAVKLHFKFQPKGSPSFCKAAPTSRTKRAIINGVQILAKSLAALSLRKPKFI